MIGINTELRIAADLERYMDALDTDVPYAWGYK
jgi:hypothetical protein